MPLNIKNGNQHYWESSMSKFIQRNYPTIVCFLLLFVNLKPLKNRDKNAEKYNKMGTKITENPAI